VTPAARRAIVAAAVIVAGCGGGTGDTTDRLPDLKLAPLDGDGPALALGELTGPAVINLWATWCAPCRQELPAFQHVSEDRPEVAFIGVDIAEDRAAARSFLDDIGVTFPQYADDSALTDALGAASLPVTLVIDRVGDIATTHLGPMSVDQLHAALDDAGASE
jgi:cytochrome c biogenesis protein CcmG, thiol:disulfide interchange protein DsbE